MPTVTSLFTRGIDVALEAGVVPSFSRIGYAVRSRVEGWQDIATLPGAGRRVVVTGANSGLGYATVVDLLRAGAHVVGTVRSAEKAEATAGRLQADLAADLTDRLRFEVADLTDLAEVRRLADRLACAGEPITGIVNNAGAMFPERELTTDGLERTYHLHVVAPFLLVASLLPQLRESTPSRVITVTSGGMYAERLDVARLESPDDYSPAAAYARAKRAQVVLTELWARRAGHLGIGFHTVHPGWALTAGVEASLPRFRKLAGPILRSPAHGAETVAWLALTPDPLPNGRLWHDRRPRSAHKVPWTRTEESESLRLWDRVSRDAGIDPAMEAAAALDAARRRQASPR